MEISEVLELTKALGAPGLVVAFMIWDRIQRNRLDEKRSQADIEMAKGLTSMGENFRHLGDLIRGNRL